MKLTKIALALAAISATPAFAVNIITQAPAVSDTNIIYISGASALSGTVGGVVTSLCAGTVTKYIDDKDGKQDAAYKCSSAAAGVGFTAGTPFILVKSDENGSFNGVGPVVNQGTDASGANTGGLNFINLTNCTATAPLTCNYASAPKVIPHAGLTDVDSKIWQGRGQFAPTTTAFQTSAGFAAQGFGVAITEVLYTALQSKQFAEGKLPGCATIPNFTPGVCQPSISREQYTSIASQTGGYHTDWAPIIGPVGAGQAVNLCRRVSTSGTQASSDTYFLSNPCANASPNFGKLSPATAADTAAGAFHVLENSSTGNVKSCLSFHNNGVDDPKTTNNEATEGKYAIGVVSLENATEVGWKFAKLSNVSPDLDTKQRQAVIDGEYDFAFEFEALWRNGAVPTPFPAPGITPFAGLDLKRTAFMNAFVGKLSDPTQVDLRGISIVPGTFDNATYPNHVGKATRFGNACQPFQMF